jgi:hypothetical protein
MLLYLICSMDSDEELEHGPRTKRRTREGGTTTDRK